MMLLLMITFGLQIKAQNDLGGQLLKNAHIGINVYNTQDYRWRNFMLGTSYGESIKAIPNAYWSAGLNVNFNKYTIYGNGNFALTNYNNSTLKTTSMSLPLLAGYEVFRTKGFGMNLYTGPVMELVLSSKLDGHTYDEINRFHAGWTIGSSFRFLYLFSFNVSYIHYPISVFSNGNLNRSAIQFAFGF